MNKNIEIEYKDFINQKMYGNLEENQEIIHLAILSNVHEILTNTHVPYNDLKSPYTTNEKDFKITNTNDGKMHIILEKIMISDTNS